MLKNLYYKTKYFFLTYLILILSSCSEPDYRLVDGSSGKLDDFLGRWLIVNYWADWCPPCIKEMPRTKTRNYFKELFGESDDKTSFAQISGYEYFRLIQSEKNVESAEDKIAVVVACLLYTSPSPRDGLLSRMPSSA